MSTPEGSSYEYRSIHAEISQLVDDSIPGKKVALVITSPGFGSSSVNSGFIRVSLVQPNERKESQKEIAEKLTKWTKQYPDAKPL
jgi:HAE1 family hydrophobic/amphiphilic exporter-1/multidrug efflux pump